MDVDVETLLKPQYDKEFRNGMIHDYKNIYYTDFMNNIRSLRGNVRDTLSLRDMYLNGKRTKYNLDQIEQGKRLCTPNQIKEYETRLIQKSSRVEQSFKDNIKDEFYEYLRNRKE